MSAVPKPMFTVAEYLARERVSEVRHEFFRGELFQMTGASLPHVTISGNLYFHLRSVLDGSRCKPLNNDMRVLVSKTGLYTYPDISFVCGEPELEDNEFDTLLNPKVIFEILSPSTETYDRGTKFKHYRKLPSLQEYILVSQDCAGVEQFVRQENNSWLMTPYDKIEDILKLSTVPASVALELIYQGVTLPEFNDPGIERK